MGEALELLGASSRVTCEEWADAGLSRREPVDR